jgi:N-acetylmuramoyl-L-alanine amidase
VKIPLDVLLPEHLPAGHPRRLEYETGLLASERFKNQLRASDLGGITVVLDAGHGGRDVGAAVEGVWESVHVYDVMVRTKQLLENYTAARVLTTTRDGESFRVDENDVLRASRGHAVLTTPPYSIVDSRIGVNLRWYLANSIHRRAAASGSPGDAAERVVFLSIHADSLHPSLRGAMAYIPDAGNSGGTFVRNSSEYSSRREVREQPQRTASQRDLQQSEGLSRQLAQSVLEAFRAEGLALHPFKPVRERVVRGRRPWVPAVLRYNTVPAKVLLEICNLNNGADRALIRTRAFRQKVAEAIASGILAYYGEDAPAPALRLAKSAAR